MSKFTSTRNKTKVLWERIEESQTETNRLSKITIRFDSTLFQKKVINIPIIEKYLVKYA